MRILTEPTSLNNLWDNKETDFSELMKIVVDINRGILAIDAEMHADLENLLLSNESNQEDLWGANIYVFKKGDDYLEFTSFINIRPAQNNRSMEVTDPNIREKMTDIINKLILR